MRHILSRLVINGLLLAGAFATLLPLLWMVSVSLMPPNYAMEYPPPLLAKVLTFEHYSRLFAQLDLGRYAVNSAVIATSTTLISLALNSLTGYAFAKLTFRGRDRLFRYLVALLVVPGQVAMFPLFLLLKQLHLINTYWAVIIPGMTSVFGIFLIRQYARSIPDSLLDAARIDGASELRIWWHLVIPICRPILVTLAMFTFLGSWSDFMWPLIVLSDSDLYTLPIALSNLLGEHALDTELMMAGAVLTLLPCLVLFVFLQKYYISGLLLGSLKE